MTRWLLCLWTCSLMLAACGGGDDQWARMAARSFAPTTIRAPIDSPTMNWGAIPETSCRETRRVRTLERDGGEVQFVRTFEYDDHGRRVRAEKYDDSDTDAEPVRIETAEYDREGRRTKKTVIVDGEVTDRRIFAYDDHGRRVRDEEYQRKETDGTPAEIKSYEHDDRDRLIRAERDYSGGGPDGTGADGDAEMVFRYTWEGDRLVREEIDERGSGPDGARPDGQPDEVTRYSYADGKIRRQEVDRTGAEPNGKGPDGTPETIETYTYTSAPWWSLLLVETGLEQFGHRIRREFHGDGRTETPPDEVWVYVHDGTGRRLREDFYVDPAGDHSSRQFYEYDSRGNRRRVTEDSLGGGELSTDPDGTVDFATRFSYHCP